MVGDIFKGLDKHRTYTMEEAIQYELNAYRNPTENHIWVDAHTREPVYFWVNPNPPDLSVKKEE